MSNLFQNPILIFLAIAILIGVLVLLFKPSDKVCPLPPACPTPMCPTPVCPTPVCPTPVVKENYITIREPAHSNSIEKYNYG